MILPCWKRQELPPDYLRFCNVPKSKWAVSLDRVPKDTDYRNAVEQYMGKLKENLEAGCGLLLRGPYGSGKSSLAAIVLREVAAHGCNPYWLEAFELSGGWRKQDKRYFDSRKAHLLVVDDLGMEDDRKAGNESFPRLLIRQALRFRLEREMATIITTNLTLEDLEQVHGDKFIALLNRHMTYVSVEGKDWAKEVAGG